MSARIGEASAALSNEVKEDTPLDFTTTLWNGCSPSPSQVRKLSSLQTTAEAPASQAHALIRILLVESGDRAVLLDHLHPHLDCGEERVRGSQQVRVGLFRASSGFRICLGSLGLLRVPLCLNAIYGCLGFVSVV